MKARVLAMRVTHPGWGPARIGVPEQILTDNGKVFTGRFGPVRGRCYSTGSVMRTGSDLLTAPCSPTTTRKVEQLHNTRRKEHFSLTEKRFASIGEAHAALDELCRSAMGIRTTSDRSARSRAHCELGVRPDSFAAGGSRSRTPTPAFRRIRPCHRWPPFAKCFGMAAAPRCSPWLITWSDQLAVAALGLS
jgi:hypothetical protein